MVLRLIRDVNGRRHIRTKNNSIPFDSQGDGILKRPIARKVTLVMEKSVCSDSI